MKPFICAVSSFKLYNRLHVIPLRFKSLFDIYSTSFFFTSDLMEPIAPLTHDEFYLKRYFKVVNKDELEDYSCNV